MGCWNETCFITGGAIRSGDPVVGFLVQQACNSGTVGEMWLPISFPIQGEYNDYGGIENPTTLFQSELETCWTNLFKDGTLRLSERGETMSKYETIGESFKLEDLLHDVEREYIAYGKKKKSYFNDSYLTLVMAHRDAYSFLLESYPTHQDKYNYWSDKKLTVEKIKDTAEMMSIYDDTELEGLGLDSFFLRRTLLSDLCGTYPPDMLPYFIEEVLKKDKLDCNLVLEGLEELKTLNRAMRELRKPLYTASDVGKGSQQDNTNLKLALSKFEVDFWQSRHDKDEAENEDNE